MYTHVHMLTPGVDDLIASYVDGRGSKLLPIVKTNSDTGMKNWRPNITT